MITFENSSDAYGISKYRKQANQNLHFDKPRILAQYTTRAKIISFENPHSDKPIFEILMGTGQKLKLRAKDVYIFNPEKGQIYSFQITSYIKENKIIQLITNIKK